MSREQLKKRLSAWGYNRREIARYSYNHLALLFKIGARYA